MTSLSPPNIVSPKIAWAGLVAGPLLGATVYALLPVEYLDANGGAVEFHSSGRTTLAVLVWMGVWWLTEAVPIYATALLPVAVFPLLGVSGMKEAAAPYGDPLIFLFMGGFFLALSMENWGLGKRIALNILRVVGARPANMVAGFMLTTAILSAFVSNTATTSMMLPIAISVIQLLKKKGNQDHKFSVCLLLGIAYSASIGGAASIIGSPSNVFLVSYLRSSIAEPYQTEISFTRWMMFGVPLAIVLLPIVFLLLTRVLYPISVKIIKGGNQLIRDELTSLGDANRGEWCTFFVFMVTATLWVLRPFLAKIDIGIAGSSWLPFAGLTDAGIAMFAALLLFLIPVDFKARRFVMDWETALKLPWGVLILFGGGLSLAAAVQANGVSEFLGGYASSVKGMPVVLIVLVVTAGIIFLTELTSNTATSATLIPILGAVAPGLGLHPYLLVFPAAFAASCAFMLPVATPPNAIVYASGEISISDMVRSGLRLNLIAIVVITLLTMLLIRPLLVP